MKTNLTTTPGTIPYLVTASSQVFKTCLRRSVVESPEGRIYIDVGENTDNKSWNPVIRTIDTAARVVFANPNHPVIPVVSFSAIQKPVGVTMSYSSPQTVGMFICRADISLWVPRSNVEISARNEYLQLKGLTETNPPSSKDPSPHYQNGQVNVVLQFNHPVEADTQRLADNYRFLQAQRPCVMIRNKPNPFFPEALTAAWEDHRYWADLVDVVVTELTPRLKMALKQKP